ncbi:MAG: hypothetical protein A2283_19175 [Lentisphaerae bacterium RIFOXYA12_FULL_48_11]|nr:MAG: hypothetical protein A2283_19175 [Lentisphaerae bacterium RIFOXYA12_FULL_48_11]
MQPIPIQVQCIAGHKADERPASFICESAHIVVEEILDRWLGAGKGRKKSESEYFKVAGKDGHDYLLKHVLDSGEWFLENRW